MADPLSNTRPSNPFEIQATKEIVQKHIEAGDITQADLDILRDSYRMIGGISLLGSVFGGIATNFLIKKRLPRWGLGPRLLAGGAAGMVGGFMGFAAGGVAASMDVRQKMPNSEKKLEIFAVIADESRNAIQQHRLEQMQRARGSTSPAGIPRSFPPATRANQPSNSAEEGGFGGDVEGDRERQEEAERERQLQGGVSRIEGDSANTGESAGPSFGKTEKEEWSSWDRLRSGNRPAPTAALPGVGSVGLGKRGLSEIEATSANEDERTKAQREFDAMLDKERQGVGAEEVWK